MSLINAFITQHLIESLEHAFVSYEPQLQSLVIDEAKAMTAKINDWINAKLAAHHAVAQE